MNAPGRLLANPELIRYIILGVIPDMKKKRLFEDKCDIAFLLILLGVFGYFALFRDVVWCGDSFQYENQFPMREPVYSLILQVLQVTAGDYYRFALGIVQNALAIICIYWTYKRISKIFEFGLWARTGTFAVLIAPHVLTPLASKTHLILTNTVMTEGITISVYYVWFTVLIGMLCDYYSPGKQYIGAMVKDVILALILSMTRGQMILCPAVWLIVVIYKQCMDKEVSTKIKICRSFLVIIILGILVLFRGGATRLYNKLESGYAVTTVSSSPMLLANIAYVSDVTDADFIEDEELREAYREIVTGLKENELTYESAPGGVIDKARFHEAGHEIINFEYIDPAMRKVIMSRYGIDESNYIELMIREDELCAEASKQLFRHVLGRYLRNYMIIAALGFVRSIAVERSIIPIVALLMYVAAIVFSIRLLTGNRNNRSAEMMIFTLIVICGTVLGTSIVIQCITRYMIYNFPFFYISAIAMIDGAGKT